MWDFIVEISILSGGLIPLMAVLLVVTLAAVVERLYFFNRVLAAGRAMEHDVQLVKYEGTAELAAVAKHFEGTIQAAVIETALAARAEDVDAMDRQIDETIMWQLPKLDRFLWVLDTAVTLAPLLGLFGTIIGMIESFGVLGVQGTGNPTAVTRGIAHALVATAGGLFIAIIAIVFLNYFNKRVRLALHQLELLKVMVVNRLHGGGSDQYGRPRGAHGVKMATKPHALAGANQ
ncbi:MAG: MotA/TolQ/ExbB proton channel family protein [Burkholderiales bacterium]